ncbi:MAG TPA: DUF262 domain-containing protein, partial [Cryobacterium sp.]|nr:DUF262 domain-containing protein [Cryobacterium sp.]
MTDDNRSLGLSLPQVIEGRLFVIADYQRPYSWEAKQLADLWEDLDLMGSTGSHYAGTLVLREEVGGSLPGSALRKCEVIDGQQRLTTCFLILDRIRRELEALTERGVLEAAPLAAEIREKYGFVTVDCVPQPRIRLGKGLNEYWVTNVLNDAPFHLGVLIAGQRRLRDAVDFVDAKLTELEAGMGAEESFRRLGELYNRISHGLGFLV